MLKEDAQAIWRAGVLAVDSHVLVSQQLAVQEGQLRVRDKTIPLEWIRRIVVVGAGKAGAGMAAAVEEVLEPVKEKIDGWVNVPADCVESLQRIRLHSARPAGVNEPRPEGVKGTQKILKLAKSCRHEDLCLVLLSGGGSALLPMPCAGISLEDKLQVVQLLMSAGARIDELNAVRKQLSAVKGGKLARASGAGWTVGLIISDVVGDRLDVIASGPTVPDSSTPQQALQILKKYARQPTDVPESVWKVLNERAQAASDSDAVSRHFPLNVENHIIGNNKTAVQVAAEEAERRGYKTFILGYDEQGVASEVGRTLARLAKQVRDQGSPVIPPACLLSGGEPVVHLTPTDQPRKGGRNQELVLAALDELWEDGMDRIVILSGGTDGEDGPTDAAGAIASRKIIEAAKQQGLNPKPFLQINDSYTFFEQVGGLWKTGPTHTNVMDLRVVLVAPSSA